MTARVDLTAVPYRLDAGAVSWVEQTLAGLTDRQKVGQLFFHLFPNGAVPHGAFPDNGEMVRDVGIGGVRYMSGTAASVRELLAELQGTATVPLLVAANCDSGGDGACDDGTYVASAAQCEATGDPATAYRAGLVSGREQAALGVNVTFNPIVDILGTWRNTIINTRAYGTDADTVIRYSSEYVRGLREGGAGAVCIKHFPGDGREERDQHLVLGVNDLSPQEWDDSFGRVYRHHVEAGVEMVMAGHIAAPEYQKQLDPTLTDADVMPATLAPELLQGLLRERLGFNGLVVTDATHMIGFNAAMPRAEAMPRAIASGCDMLLFFNDAAEDVEFVLAALADGRLPAERLDDAVRRVLGLKAKLGLPARQAAGTLADPGTDLSVVGCEEHLRWRAEAADAGLTLVKDPRGVLPLDPATHRRIRLYYLDTDSGGIVSAAADACATFVKELEARGFEVTVNDGSTRAKGRISDYHDQVDAAVVVANLVGYAAENTYRVRWRCAMSTDSPWYVGEVPTVLVSLNYTTHLHDLSMVPAAVNAYDDNPENIRQAVAKLVGETPFRGTPNELVWTGKWEARR